LDDILGDGEVVTSTTLIDRLEHRGIKRNHARQLLLRATEASGIWRSERLMLEAGARVYCRRTTWGQPLFHIGIARLLKDHRRGLHRVWTATRGGVVLTSEVRKLLAAPLTQRETTPYPLLEEEVAALVDIGAVEWEAKGTAVERITDFRLKGSVQSVQAAKLRWAQRAVAAQLTRILADQLRKSNFLTWGSLPPAERQDFVPFNNYPFDHVGFTRLGPLLRFTDQAKKPSPTPVVFEVRSEQCSLHVVEGFLDRMKRAGMNPSSRLPILGVIAAPDFSREAWRLAKNEGLMAINLCVQFGDAALGAMARIEQLLRQVGNLPDKISDEGLELLGETILQAVGSPIINDLRSLGFETLSGLMLAVRGWEGVELNQSYPFKAGHDTSDVTRELDVFGSRAGGEELIAIECKAEHATKPLSREYLHRFFCETVPSMVAAKFPEGRAPKKVIAQIWTTGTVEEDLRQALRAAPLPANYEVDLLDGSQVKALVPYTLGKAIKLIDSIAVAPAELR